ncbi:integrase core domain-containing protein [Paenibacillus tritici]|uniref:integrase core domain-containing protein n=1 Tax=Paenibacillus tritici TaxID=1873425 RepID=UPI001BA4562D|nr:integrase core domain-containing protein [Paenibacillus tritici]QUL57060.1 integrase core domain-containing protein [Paenibacillus tritici]
MHAVIRTDNGPQFVSRLFGDMCESWEMTYERIPPKTPDLNAFIESFHSNIDRDLFRKEAFNTFEEAYEAVDRYMDFYNNRRMHTSLRNMPPATFAEYCNIKILSMTSDFMRKIFRLLRLGGRIDEKRINMHILQC